MSWAPIWSGTMKLASPASTGTITKKTIPVPCIVTTSLYELPVMRVLSGFVSWVRISSARKPEIAKNSPAVVM